MEDGPVKSSLALSVAAGHRQAALVCLGVSAIRADLPARARAPAEQSGREFASDGAPTRAQATTLQISPIRPALPQHACRRRQHLQPSTPPRLQIHTAEIPRRCCGAMGDRCRSRMTLRQIKLLVRAPNRCRDKAPTPHVDGPEDIP